MAFQWLEAREILSRTPRLLRALLADVTPAWTAARERPESWSPHEVLAHLIQGERDDWVPRARRILEVGTASAFEPFERDAHLAWCGEHSVVDLLDEFAAQRETNLRTVDDMAPGEEALRQRGTHLTLGPVTLEQLLATWVVHDLNHVNQITRALAARYSKTVGPWNHRDFLRILNGD